MSAPQSPSQPPNHLSQQLRMRLIEGLCLDFSKVDAAVLEFLSQAMEQTGTQREMQGSRDAWAAYKQTNQQWIQETTKAWRHGLESAATPSAQAPMLNMDSMFELVSDDVVDNKIAASRMALSIADKVCGVFDSLRNCIQTVDGIELSPKDIVRPETLCLLLVEAWVKTGISREMLLSVMDTMQRSLAEVLLTQYQATLVFLKDNGITPRADLRSRVRRTAHQGLGTVNLSGSAPLAATSGATTGYAATSFGQQQPGGVPSSQALAQAQQQALMAMATRAGALTGYATGIVPLLRARQRAQGVMGQLRRLLTQPATGFDMVNAPPASAALAHALTAHRIQADSYYSGIGTIAPDQSPQAVSNLANEVKERSTDLKKKATTAGEKAIIEVVALMFQSILTEDRIPPGIRIWFARLQVPVLRVALAEPEFFSNLDHPARQLIDRMGACVMGFDSTSINGTALEAEVRRVVQVIEQYPETGRRVFQLVYDEFEKFLSKFLTEKQTTSKLVSVAQQVEQKETLAIQYTIELRTMLRDMPVRDEIREFLFKTWAEVLAISAVRDGVDHADTVALRSTATDLVWAASAKPNRSDRALVIQTLPNLLLRLRQGLSLLGISGSEQDTQIKVLTDTLADAFLSKTAPIAQAHLDAMAKRLANLEDFISDASLKDLPLNTDNIEMMLGIDASSIHVIADNGAPVEPNMITWAQSLPLGVWFTLDHSGVTAQVQYAWQSQRKQLHLFAAADGSSYLIQLKRLAAYLQAGLLVAKDEEGLTARATRDALAKLDANPERLLD